MKIKNPFSTLTKFERGLWIFSMIAVTLSFIISSERDILNLAASLVGVTALIFVARGYVIGQVLIVVFSVLYGMASFRIAYYGEMITYLCMSAPIAVLAIISWVRHPYEGTKEVKVSRVSRRALIILSVLTVIVTVAFYFILKALGTAKLPVSTFSVATSFIAASLTALRSPYYALGYAANDVVLIILWVAAAFSDISNLPMAVCFVVFFANDVYGFISWQRMQRRQAGNN